MLSTCRGGCESFSYLFCLALASLYPLISFTAYPLTVLEPGYSYSGPEYYDAANLCLCSTVGYSLLSACGGCQGRDWFTYDSCRCFLSQLLELMYLLLAGHILRPTAQRLCLPPRELLSCRESIGLDIDVGAQVPQPYPVTNICSPLGSPRRHSLFLIFFCFDNVLTERSRMRTIGTLTNRMPPVVSVSLVSSPYLLSHTRATFIDSPELGPGTIPGPSSSSPSVFGSSTSNNAASSTAVSNTATPTPVGGRSSSVGAIAGGIAGGIAVISIIIAALLFYRQRSRASSAASAGGVLDPHMDQIQWPVSGQETATTLPETRNSLMKPYVHVSRPQFRLCVLMCFLFF